jgi:hypothetical protein
VPDNDPWLGDFERRNPPGVEDSAARPDLRETSGMPSAPQKPGHTGYTTGRVRAYQDEGEWE